MPLRIHEAALLALATSSCLLAPRRARAQPGPGGQVTLVWSRGEGAEGCPDGPRAERDIAARLGRYPFSPAAPRAIAVRVTRDDGHWLARIDERAGGDLLGTRRLPSDAPDCAPLYSATVLVLSLVIDAGAVGRSGPSDGGSPSSGDAGEPASPPGATRPDTASPPGATRPDTASPPGATRPDTAWSVRPGGGASSSVSPEVAVPAAPGAPVLPPAVPSPSPAWPRVTLHARAVAAPDLLPRAALGAAIAGSVEGTLFEGSAGMLLLPETATRDGQFAFGLTAAWLGLCVRPIRFGAGSLGACGSFQAGAYHSVVRALDVFEPLDPGDRAWAALSFSPQIRVAVAGPLSAEVGLDVVVPLLRYASKAGAEVVFTVPEAGVLPFAGLGIALP